LWRSHLKVCHFKEEDCNPAECNLYNLPYEKEAIKNRIKEELAKIKTLDKEKDILIINDLTRGISIMAKALDDISGGFYTKLSKSKCQINH